MIHLILGKETRELDYEKIIKEIKEANPGITTKYYDCNETSDYDRFLEDVTLTNLFAPKELLILKRAEKLKNLDMLIETIKLYVNTAKEVIIDFFDEEGTFETKLKKLLSGIDIDFVCSKTTKTGLPLEVKNYIKSELSLNSTEAEMLFNLIATNDISRINNEIKKIKNMELSKFDIDQIKNIISSVHELSIFDLAEKLLKFEKKELLNALENRKDLLSILYIIASNLKSILKLKLITQKFNNKFEKNYVAFTKGSYIKLKEYFTEHPYVLFKKLEFANSYSLTFIEKKLNELLEVETKIKAGEIDENFAVQLFVLNFNQ